MHIFVKNKTIRIMWWITVGLLIAGLVFMFVEMLLVPGVGVAGFFSLAAFAAACWYTFE